MGVHAVCSTQGMHASIAERIVYGRPFDPVADDTRAPVVPRSGTALVGRILMAAIFLTSGFAKLADPDGTAGYMAQAGVGNADSLVYVAGMAELAGGMSLLFGFLTRLGAIGLLVFLTLTSLIMHKFWGVPPDVAKMQFVQFMKNLSIMGGLLMVVAMGPGRYSIDRVMRRPRAA
jgi:putative oxidoreductase